MKKVVSLGEVLLRLSPPQYQTLTQATSLECQFGGSELNVLASLVQLGHQASLVTALPGNDLGKMTKSFLYAKKIGLEHLIQKGERLGLYYYQKGYSLRASRVIYDRKHSAFWETVKEDYAIETIFQGADWFHVSGITPLLTENLYDITILLMKKAKSIGITVSFDLNFRESLGYSFEEARHLLSPFVALADVCIGIEPIALPTDDQNSDLKDQLGLTRPYENKEVLEKVVSQIAKDYHISSLAFTQREMGHMNEYLLKAYLYQDGHLFETEKSGIQVLDRVGTGDAFTAGLIHGLLEKESAQTVLNIAMTAFKFKHTIEGDINTMSRQDLEQLLASKTHEIKR
ncbi:sugar kinase [Streptococcus didelphis]|uniref:Sugar kinase n=1 Tax=Streptococcus didelphis TaxID=102886 RepID=A0ABY9LGV9_9STRE|nr:sugar kinase [Streptococcus didelphis]WMB28104.1 sugar kinase [Streptococcus didelphis]